MASTWGSSWGASWLTSWDGVFVPPVTPPATTPLSGGSSKSSKRRKRVFIWEPPEEEQETLEPVPANRETVRRAIVRAYKSGEKELGLLRFSTEPNGPKLDVIDLIHEMRTQDVLYAQNLVNLLKKLRDDEDEEDIELLLMS